MAAPAQVSTNGNKVVNGNANNLNGDANLNNHTGVNANANTEVNGVNGQLHFPEQPTEQEQRSVVVNGQQVPTDQQGKTKSASKARTFGLPLRALTKKGPPGGYDDTPLPEAPQGYTLRFNFKYAENLPPSDWTNASSDPFLTATLKGTNPKRHKEDPDLVHRTPTARETTAPVWNSEWVVANVPPTGFTLKCRMYDEDYPDGNDRLGNVTLKIASIDDSWGGVQAQEYSAKKRVISKRAFILKGVSSVLNHNFHMTPRLCISIEVLGKSDPPYAQMYTIGPAFWFKHFSPMIGRITGTKVNADSDQDGDASRDPPAAQQAQQKKHTQKYE